MITLLQPNTSLFSCVADILFIYFNFSSVQGFFFFPLQHISKYTTVLINKFIFKVTATLIPVLCCAKLPDVWFIEHTQCVFLPNGVKDSSVGCDVGVLSAACEFFNHSQLLPNFFNMEYANEKGSHQMDYSAGKKCKSSADTPELKINKVINTHHTQVQSTLLNNEFHFPNLSQVKLRNKFKYSIMSNLWTHFVLLGS